MYKIKFKPGRQAHIKPIGKNCIVLAVMILAQGEHKYLVEYWETELDGGVQKAEVELFERELEYADFEDEVEGEVVVFEDEEGNLS